MTKRESILVALLATITAGAPSLGTRRNVAVGDVLPGVFSTLSDGDIETVEELFNPPIYEFTMTPVLTLVRERSATGDIDAELDGDITAAMAALGAITDLGDLITAIRPQPPDYAPKGLFGAADLKGCDIAIEIDFWSDRSGG